MPASLFPVRALRTTALPEAVLLSTYGPVLSHPWSNLCLRQKGAAVCANKDGWKEKRAAGGALVDFDSLERLLGWIRVAAASFPLSLPSFVSWKKILLLFFDLISTKGVCKKDLGPDLATREPYD